MSTTSRPDVPRYVTLRDYVRVVRRYRLVIALVTLACGAAAFWLTARQRPTYQAQASVYFQDTSQELNLLGDTTAPTVPVSTLAQISAQAVTEPPIVDQAQRLLGPGLSSGQLAASVTTAINTSTFIVAIQATSGQPQRAEAIANAFARAAKLVGQRSARAQYAGVVATVRRQFAPLIAPADPATRAAYRDRIATLEVLAKSADPVQIVQRASVPTVPTGPRTVRDTVLGLLLGLTLGLLAAFLRDALDRRLRVPTEIAEQLGWPVIAHVREDAFKTHAFLTANGKPAGEKGDREAFRMLRESIRFMRVDDPPRSLVVTSALPEEGKSTVAVSLACASAAAGVPTLLVECDLRRPSLADRHGLAKAPGLTDYLLGSAKPAEIVQLIELPTAGPDPSSSAGVADSEAGDAGSLGRAAANADGGDALSSRVGRQLACITAGRSAPETAELLGSLRFKTFLTEVTRAYELVVLDSGPLLSVADSTVLVSQADAALVCVRSGRATYEEASALKEAIERLPSRPVGVVVTGVKPEVLHDLGYYSYLYDARS